MSRGFREEQGLKNPDYFLVNTCTVTSGADQKSRNIIRRCAKANPKAKVIVTGCLAEKDWGQLANIRGIGLVIKKSFFPDGISRFSGHTRAFLKIQDGCANFCTYCKVALVRGSQKSKKLKQVFKEAKALVACGYREIVLTGICLGAYGRDLSPAQGLVDVIDILEGIEGLERIRISSIEAGDVSSRLISRMGKSKKLCRHLHIPIQSGDDNILIRMNRKYTGKKYQELVAGIKRDIPGVSITTDCLVGFPGETEENFENTLNLARKIIPLNIHIFPYSSRPGTKAAEFKDKVDPKLIRQRRVRLEKVAAECRGKFMKSFMGKTALVLIEGASNDDAGLLEGLTDNYLKVKLPFKPGLANMMVRAKLKNISGGSFTGEYVDKY